MHQYDGNQVDVASFTVEKDDEATNFDEICHQCKKGYYSGFWYFCKSFNELI